MYSQQLQQRLASSSQASCSNAAARPMAYSRPSPCGQPSSRYNLFDTISRKQHLCRATGVDDQTADEIVALDPSQDTVYDRMTYRSNSRPNFEDDDWIQKVEDWEDFWYSTEDDLLEELEDEQQGSLSPMERSADSLKRAQLLVSQLGNMRKRADVEQMITPDVRPPPFYEDTYTPERDFVDAQPMEAPDPNPDYDAIDLRALSEKRSARAALDEEWKRREALLARPYSFTLRLEQDARLTSHEFDWIREEWTHEQIMDLIVGGGKFVHPDKVKARALNPLLPIDFHNEVKTHYVPDTEEFLEMIGHLATEKDIMYLQSAEEIQLHSKDFVDTTQVFEAQDGTQYVDAPPNPWAEMRKARDAEDLVLFDQLVNRMMERQEAAEEGEDEGAVDDADQSAYNVWDDVMGDGFTEFVAADDAGGGGVMYYDEELEGELSESDVIERDEAEEDDGNEDPNE